MESPLPKFLDSLLLPVIQLRPKSAPYWVLLKPPYFFSKNSKISRLKFFFYHLRHKNFIPASECFIFSGITWGYAYNTQKPHKYEVHLTIISPGPPVSYFAGNLCSQRMNKGQIKQDNIMGVQNFIGIYSCLCAHQQEWYQICLIIFLLFITVPQNLYQLPFFPSLPQ